MKIVNRKISELIGSEYNPRKITDKEMSDLEDSIKRFGITEPILVNMIPERENIIISGHQRIQACKNLKLENVPCIEVKLDPEREKELNVRMNRAGGSWDWDIMKEYFTGSELVEYGFEDYEIQFNEMIVDDGDLYASPGSNNRHDFQGDAIGLTIGGFGMGVRNGSLHADFLHKVEDSLFKTQSEEERMDLLLRILNFKADLDPQPKKAPAKKKEVVK